MRPALAKPNGGHLLKLRSWVAVPPSVNTWAHIEGCYLESDYELLDKRRIGKHADGRGK